MRSNLWNVCCRTFMNHDKHRHLDRLHVSFRSVGGSKTNSKHFIDKLTLFSSSDICVFGTYLVNFFLVTPKLKSAWFVSCCSFGHNGCWSPPFFAGVLTGPVFKWQYPPAGTVNEADERKRWMEGNPDKPLKTGLWEQQSLWDEI